MRHLSSEARSNSNSSAPSETGGFGEPFAGEDHYQELIDLANTVPLVKIFARYNIRCNEFNYMIRCPLKSHKGGKENSGSFKYYHETNSFHCFGCHVGHSSAHASHFVAAMESVPLHKAAQKIIDIFKNDLGDVDDSLVSVDYNEQLKIMLDFSETVREFYQTYASEEARVYVDGACLAYDTLSLKHENLDNEALKNMVEDIKDYIKSYKE